MLQLAISCVVYFYRLFFRVCYVWNWLWLAMGLISSETAFPNSRIFLSMMGNYFNYFLRLHYYVKVLAPYTRHAAFCRLTFLICNLHICKEKSRETLGLAFSLKWVLSMCRRLGLASGHLVGIMTPCTINNNNNRHIQMTLTVLSLCPFVSLSVCWTGPSACLCERQ